MTNNCAIRLISCFDCKDVDVVRAYIQNVKARCTHMKMIVATTCTGQIQNGWDHLIARQVKGNQEAAMAALKAEGFKCTKTAYNHAHHHNDTGVKLWWFVVKPEHTKTKGE